MNKICLLLSFVFIASLSQAQTNIGLKLEDFSTESQSNIVKGYDVQQLKFELAKLDLPQYSANGFVPIKGTLKNIGYDPIKSFDISYSINGKPASTVETISGLNIAYNESYDFAHTEAYNFTSDKDYQVELTVSNINGGNNMNQSNKSTSQLLQVRSTFPQRTVVLEQYTTENCGNCPAVLSIFEDHLDVNPNFVMMCHHSGYGTDKFTTTASQATQMLDFYNAGGSIFTPAGMVDRNYNGLDNDEYQGIDPGPVFWNGYTYGTNYIDARTNLPAPVSVEITGTRNTLTGELTIEVSGEFFIDQKQELGISLWITQDKINSLSQAGNTGIWTHRFVTRDVITPRLGTSITSSTNEGDLFSYSTTYTPNTAWVLQDLYLVGMVNNMDQSNPNNREIQNAVQIKVTDLKATTKVSYLEESFKIYPNPANSFIFIETENFISAQIVGISGKEIINTNNSKIDISMLNSGLYFITVRNQTGSHTERITISK